jgi:hypothetical protein
MALSTRPSQSTVSKRIWKTPTSRTNLIWFICSLLLYGGIYAWYLVALKQQQFPGPFTDPLRLFGIISFVLVLMVTAYTLRRRFVRWLPGKVQGWLWLHTWFGVITILIAFLHENYASILHDYDFSLAGFTGSAGGQSALFLLIALVISGVIGRLLDSWQAHTISNEANRNGVGISRSVKDRLHEIELNIERLNAGKSPEFKAYCEQSLKNRKDKVKRFAIQRQEMDDLGHLRENVIIYHKLQDSLKRHRRAEITIAGWRYVHIPLACLAVIVISFHSLSELWMIFFPH